MPTPSTHSTPTKPDFPTIHLLLMEDKFVSAFEDAFQTYPLPSSTISLPIHNCRLADLPSTVRFDAIVSPANSYARLDGAFDDALSRVFSPKKDYFALTRAAQAVIYKKYRGFAPPGTCTLVDLQGSEETLEENPWGCRYLALCPTMKIPQHVG
jgi:hypothetical protein